MESELTDAAKDLAPDTAFGIAYNAALRLCTIGLYASGYRVRQGANHHHYSIRSLPLVLGNQAEDLSNFLDTCRKKRHTANYDSIGMISPAELKELLRAVEQLEAMVREWLMEEHENLLA